jgi:very-short-patch-repair endonuclease
MSPLSVAQFLDANTQSFDVVVFDEASQIQVWDSIGAIARGKQLIVVGDPHQLPPTSFFTAKGEGDDTPNEDGSTVDADEESILDELRSFQLRERSLKWHYRSKQEGLIAFSNRTYYKNGLLTFPSSNTGSFGVTLKYLPNAVYDKGETSTNPIEAKALVDEFLRRIKTKDGAKLSYGIVTFSLPQREVVLKCLEEARRSNPEIEEHFGEKCPVDGEPVFVKNLESVQGDERDVILFSICYGPDKEGKVSHNFGPLTQTGGHRRLNVAITRAKHEAIVFTCMKSEQIDLERTSATGVRDLKGFLEFAERGNLRAAGLSSTKQALTTKGLEGLIAQRLESEGYQIRTGIGMSNYRIDIGVIHPKDPTKYVLGIECDGDCYQKAETARDRDSLRGGVLTTLGWRLHRVWSMDWWHNPEKEFLRIREAILAATEAEDAKTAARAISGTGTNWP